MAKRKIKTEKNMESRLGALRAELETLEGNMKTVAGDVEGIADHRVHLALRKAEDVAHNAYRLAEETVTHIAHGVDEWANDGIASTRKTIRERPVYALALTIGVGALIGAMIMRR